MTNLETLRSTAHRIRVNIPMPTPQFARRMYYNSRGWTYSADSFVILELSFDQPYDRWQFRILTRSPNLDHWNFRYARDWSFFSSTIAPDTLGNMVQLAASTFLTSQGEDRETCRYNRALDRVLIRSYAFAIAG